MSKPIPAVINNKMLKWARINAGYENIYEVATRTKYKAEKLEQWEKGEAVPSLRQAEKLAKFFQCSYSIFSLNAPPSVLPLAKDYRRLPGVNPGKESPELRSALRDLLYRRKVAYNLMEELGETPDKLQLSVKLNENPEEVASRIRSCLGLTIENQFSWRNHSDSWKYCRQIVESSGVLVLLFSGVEPEEVRGVSLFNSQLPAIGINNHEISSSRTFTLFHEFVHILLNNGAEEMSAFEENKSDAEWFRIERFSESVAGAILIPKDALLKEPQLQKSAASSQWELSVIQRLAKKYKVTPLAFATRLFVLNYMSPNSYKNWKEGWKEYLAQNPPKKEVGFATPAQKALNRNGNILTSLIINALSYERITSVDASRYLKINYPHVEELRMYFEFGRQLPSYTSGK